MTFNEHDIVRATVDIQREDCTIKKGDKGTIVHICVPREAYVVEFIRKDYSDIITMYPDELEAT